MSVAIPIEDSVPTKVGSTNRKVELLPVQRMERVRDPYRRGHFRGVGCSWLVG